MDQEVPRRGVPQAEVPLAGGIANAGLVVRVGDTVRRPQRPTSPATQALLRHLEAVGFAGAPRFLGIDDQGREVLSYLPGEALNPPYPSWALTDATLRSVAGLLRDYHAAVAGFDPAPYAWPASPPAPYVTGLVSHNDPNLDNVVFRDGQVVALIDFDLASPGSALWDVAHAARLWAPLRDPADVADARRTESLRRLRVFVDACGVVPADRPRLAEAIEESHGWIYDLVHSGADAGSPGYAAYWYGGGAERAARTRSWFLRHRRQVLEALLDPDGGVLSGPAGPMR